MNDFRLAAAESYLTSLIAHSRRGVEVVGQNDNREFRILLAVALNEWARGLKGNVPWATGMHRRSYVDLLAKAYANVVEDDEKCAKSVDNTDHAK